MNNVNYDINQPDHVILKIYNLLENIEVIDGDIDCLVRDGYDYSEEEVEYLKEHLTDLTADLIDYLIYECTQDALSAIIDHRLYMQLKDQSNTAS